MGLAGGWSGALRLGLVALVMLAVPPAREAAAEPARRAAEPAFQPLRLGGHAVRWMKVPAGEEMVLTYALADARLHHASADNCGRIDPPDRLAQRSRLRRADFRRELERAFGLWSAAARISFVETDDVDAADIVIGAQAEPQGRAFAQVFHDTVHPGPTKPITRALICLNPEMPWKVGFDGNHDVYDLRYTFAHEIGHAIGLDHPPRRGPLMWHRYDETIHGLEPGDIAGAVALYGARVAGLSHVGFRP